MSLSMQECKSNSVSMTQGKKKLITHETVKGQAVKMCTGLGPQYKCCNLRVIEQMSNCPFECTYCFLQGYLNNTVTQIQKDTKTIIEQVKDLTQKYPKRFFRFGTGDLADSLAISQAKPQVQELISEFQKIPNCFLELKTKSKNVTPLFFDTTKKNVVVSWSMNPQNIITSDEHKTASLTERLEVAQKVIEHGYLVGFHFDPMIAVTDWENEYANLIDTIAQYIPESSITWMSLGALRLAPEVKEAMIDRFPKSALPYGEFVFSEDGKYRYIKPLRVKMYELMLKKIRDRFPKIWVYLCMEYDDIWKKVMPFVPDDNGHLDYLFALSLYERFSAFFANPPERSFFYDEI